ncbi:MAG: hypothetical protein Kow00109_24830 [Acidobacteriota bacterium]
MRKFAFRLAPYLKLCEHRENQERQRLAEMLQERQRLADHLGALQNELAELLRRMRQRSAMPAYEAGWYRARISALEVGIEDAGRRLESFDEEVAGQRNRLIQARRETRVVERLKEKQWQRYQAALETEAQKEVDDLFSQKVAGRLQRLRRRVEDSDQDATPAAEGSR